MGQIECVEHNFAVRPLGAGMARMHCRSCGKVLIDLDAVKDGPSVTAPGLFGPSRPTIFSVLAEERRRLERSAAEVPPTRGPAFAFGGSAARW